MMRLQRIGRKNDPSYRVVVTDKRNGPRAGNHADTIGTYNPKLGNFQVDADKAKEWITKGVQPSDTVHNFLVAQGIIDGKKRNVLPKKTPIVSEKPAEEKAETPAQAPVAVEETVEVAPVAEEVAVEATPEETPAEVVKEETTVKAEVVEEKVEGVTSETTETEEKKAEATETGAEEVKQ